jgi:hypothetical protein
MVGPPGPGDPRGQATGFFVGPHLIVTALHALPDGVQPPLVHNWQRRKMSVSILARTDRPGIDLALLKLEAAGVVHPSVCLSVLVLVNDPVWLYGYPANMYRAGCSATFKYEGPAIRDDTILLTVADGQSVPGFSGAPVLNLRTGGVCGLMRISRNTATDLGGRVVPSEVILAEFPQVREAQRHSEETNKEWLSTLSRGQLIAGDWPYPSRELLSYLDAAHDVNNRMPFAMDQLGLADRSALYIPEELEPSPEPVAGDGRAP